MNDLLAPTILLVEDDDVAAESAVRGLQRVGAPFPVVLTEDGAAALAALRGEDPQHKVPRPRVILLDLNMLRMNGFEFLRALRADDTLTDDIVFVLTTSDADTDRARVYHQHVAGYMVKAAVGPQFSRLAQLPMDCQASVRWP